MNERQIKAQNEKWLARDYNKFKESQSKLNKHYRLDFRSEEKKGEMQANQKKD